MSTGNPGADAAMRRMRTAIAIGDIKAGAQAMADYVDATAAADIYERIYGLKPRQTIDSKPWRPKR